MEKIVIISHLTFKDYLKTNYELIYKKGSTIFFTIIGLFMITMCVFSAVNFPEEPIDTVPLIMGCVLLLIYPISIYFSSKKVYTTTKRIGERIEYTFDEEVIVVKGESYETTFSWDKLYKVTTTRECLLLWESELVAVIIPKRYFSLDQLDLIKGIVDKYNYKKKSSLK